MRGLLAWIVTAACVAAPHPAIAAEAVPLAAFGRLPSLEDIAISPDGSKIAFVKTNGESRSLVVAPLSKHEIIGGVRLGDIKLRGVEWVDDDNVLATVSSTSPPPFGFIGATREWYQLVNFNVSKQKLSPLTLEVEHAETFNVITGDTSVREVSGHSMLYTSGYCVRDTTVPCLFSVEYPDRRTRLVNEAIEPDTQWLLDQSGSIAALFTYHDEKKLWEIKTRKNGHWTVVASGIAPIDTPQMVGFSADGSAIVVRFRVNGEAQWKPLNLSDNTWGAPLAQGVSFASVIEDRKTGRIIGGIREIGSSECVFFDNELQAHWNAVLRAFPDERVSLVSRSDDFSRMVLRVFGPKDGYVYALYDWYSHHATILGRVYEDVHVPAEMKAISYAAADGLTIPAFLTLPQAAAGKGSAVDRVAAWRPCRCRHAGFRLVVAGTGGARLCRAAAQFPRLNAGFKIHGGGLWRVGPQNADRFVRWRALSCASRHHRSEARLHRWGKLWRLCGACRRHD